HGEDSRPAEIRFECGFHGVPSCRAGARGRRYGDPRRACVSALACPPVSRSQARWGSHQMAGRRAWIACVSMLGRVATADDAEDRDMAGRVATNPIPIVEAVKVKPSYTFAHGDTQYEAELQFEGVFPYTGALIPGLAIDDVWSVARVQVTGESL